MPNFTNIFVVELSVLRGVPNCLWSNVIKAAYMKIYIFLLLKVNHVSDSAAEDTTLRIVLHYVCICMFFSGLGFIGLVEVQLIRWK